MDIYLVLRVDLDSDVPKYLGMFTDDYATDEFIDSYCKYNDIDPNEKDDIIQVILLEG